MPLLLLEHAQGEHRLPRAPLEELSSSLDRHLERLLVHPLGLEADPVLQVCAIADEEPNSVVIAFATLVRHRFVNAMGLSWHPLAEVLPGEGARPREPDFDPLAVVARLADASPVQPIRATDRLIAAHAVALLRAQLTAWPALARLTPPTFTLTYLQRSVEALIGVRLHTQNFRRLILDADLLEPVGLAVLQGTGRPATLYRFASKGTGRLRDSLLHGARLPK